MSEESLSKKNKNHGEFECEVCKMTFPTKEEYEKHMAKEHRH
ncbi:zinc finger C2H2-type domain protein [Methanosalsum zhilinae DSM 4017]|uniref:Zinc finger C2H2-type domain protein n=1 Tax=Methanosalsum zhilinae (strain DSM 4017 / NBRC 107636 / OCM 62 / WeN5) TaxID=679901 RepID=F7XLY9_METZD|nr:C2H2-type zinc finger protein [Methanosalsum zhilinae]AEH60917.1 zinc finger C2H2-type domain protein [Methanosalsum zhilinae DSM 4017]